jgi:N-acetylglucosaminyl-diphospho-decaprenol L-rhamnosyltransferase
VLAACSHHLAISVISRKNIPIIIVGYRNARDVAECLEALQRSESEPPFDVYICENGGASAFDTLILSVSGRDGPCDPESVPETITDDMPRFVRLRRFQLRGRLERVLVAEAKENLGYAGAINAWLRVLMATPEWPGLWILNPDTQPDARALSELVAWANTRGKGMVGSRIVPSAMPAVIHSRGLRWRLLHASTEAVDYHAPADIEPNPDELESRLDAPAGASIYVTRSCLERVGLMDERYFLYFEDLDWGYRAKETCGVGYAYRSIVPHYGGTTIGSAGRRSQRSPLSVYLEFRNRVHFVRRYHPYWVPWTVLVLLIRPLEYGLVGAFINMWAAFRGVCMGILGETGRPESFIKLHGRWNAPR